MIKLFAAIVTLLLASVVCGQVRNPPPLGVGPDWVKAYAHAKAGKHVQLKIFDLKPNDDKSLYRIYLVDSDDMGKPVKQYIASAAPGHSNDPSNYLFGLSQFLKELAQPPSKNAKIYVSGGTFRIYEVNLK